jgi:hypothetical protein
MAIINVRYTAPCRACGATIQAGTQANYINSRLFCLGCKTNGAYRPRRKPAGYYNSLRDPRGLYAADGRMIARVACRCEDYPCCGC